MMHRSNRSHSREMSLGYLHEQKLVEVESPRFRRRRLGRNLRMHTEMSRTETFAFSRSQAASNSRLSLSGDERPLRVISRSFDKGSARQLLPRPRTNTSANVRSRKNTVVHRKLDLNGCYGGTTGPTQTWRSSITTSRRSFRAAKRPRRPRTCSACRPKMSPSSNASSSKDDRYEGRSTKSTKWSPRLSLTFLKRTELTISHILYFVSASF